MFDREYISFSRLYYRSQLQKTCMGYE